MRALLAVSILAAATVSSHGLILAQQPAKGTRLSDVPWPTAENLLRADTVVVIPLGAASIEHGYHLTLGNDAALADYLVRRVVDAADVVAAPPLSYHFYPAFGEYPGSTSLTLDTARALTAEVALSLARFGPRRFYVLNTGISTTQALEPAARALAAQGVLLRYTDFGSHLDRASGRVRRQEGGTHADEVETSMMLYIDPAGVEMTRAVREFTPSADPLQLTRTVGGPGTFSRSGVSGDATLATREKGSVIVEALVAGILGEIDALRRASVPAPGAVTPSSAARTSFAGARSATGPGGCTEGDERTVRGVGDALTLHWSNADAASLSLMWSEQGDMVHPDGLTERGREIIKMNRVALFMRREYRGSKHPLTIANIRCLSADIAVADGRWELRGVTDPGGRVLPPFEGLCTLVMRRIGGDWLIEAYRYSQKPSAAPMPTLLKRPGFPGDR
jgi:creatinine amidohydrolase